jgi:hypothetical protein
MLNKQKAKLCIERAESIIKNCKSFKIGKTGQTLENRFNLKYKTDFENVKQLYYSRNEQLINQLESTLNSYFISHPKNSNLKEGSAGDMTDTNDKYLLYIVFTPQRSLIEKIIKKFNQE